jgi:hypothetical protein
MSLFALFSWIATAGAGLYLLSIWLIEYDKDFNAATATRLPLPVLAAHVLFAVGGLLVWADYVVQDNDHVAFIAVAAILLAASLGVTMAVRWFGVRRTNRARAQLAQIAAHRGGVAVMDGPSPDGPPERNFPLPIVIAHGALATLTITLVLLSIIFGS